VRTTILHCCRGRAELESPDRGGRGGAEDKSLMGRGESEEGKKTRASHWTSGRKMAAQGKLRDHLEKGKWKKAHEGLDGRPCLSLVVSRQGERISCRGMREGFV